MRRCLSCQGRFDEHRRVCPDDGDILISEGKPAADSGRVLDGKYRLGNLIGEGGMGQVFDATVLSTEERVAVKLLKSTVVNKNAKRRFRLEAEAMSALNHPGAVKVVEFKQASEGLTYIAMERLFGPTFSDLRRAGKFASPERVVELMAQACDVVAAAHGSGIVHRDLKPTNLILHRIDRERSQVKVLDFGIAKFMDGLHGSGLTSTGEMVGTLTYMAPEQSRGRPVSPATDVYALGVILFEALAGRLPFEARTAAELIWMQASAPAPALSTFRPDITGDLDDLVARCLSKRPENRFSEAGALARALSTIRAARPLDDPQSTRTLRVNPSLWVGTVLDERYELHEWIAPGRFRSHVYRATHLRTGASVAVRVWRTGKGAVRDCLIEAFRNEARAMGVRHPNLIAIVDLGFTDECVYIVTEMVESSSLREILQTHPLPRSLTRELIQGAADAIGALHGKGIVSGGLSPETIRVTGPPEHPAQLLLSPLGLTNLKQVEALLDPEWDVEGDRMRDYMSPEQRGGAVPDPRSDTFSLGLLLLEMLGGQIHASLPTLDATVASEEDLSARLAGPRSSTGPEGRSEEGHGGIADRGEAGSRPPPATRPPASGEKRGAARSPAARIASLRHEPHFVPSIPQELPQAWREFMRRAIALDPQQRFQTAEEFAAALPRD